MRYVAVRVVTKLYSDNRLTHKLGIVTLTAHVPRIIEPLTKIDSIWYTYSVALSWDRVV